MGYIGSSRRLAPVEPSTDLSDIAEALGRVHRMLQSRLPTSGSSGGVTREQWSVLVAADRAGPAGATMGQLATDRGIGLNSVSTLVDRMVLSGILERRTDERDRRVVRVVPTTLGRRLRKEVGARRKAVLTGLLSELTDEQIGHLRSALPALRALAEAGL